MYDLHLVLLDQNVHESHHSGLVRNDLTRFQFTSSVINATAVKMVTFLGQKQMTESRTGYPQKAFCLRSELMNEMEEYC